MPNSSVDVVRLVDFTETCAPARYRPMVAFCTRPEIAADISREPPAAGFSAAGRARGEPRANATNATNAANVGKRVLGFMGMTDCPNQWRWVASSTARLGSGPRRNGAAK